jgi:hypothetical protein
MNRYSANSAAFPPTHRGGLEGNGETTMRRYSAAVVFPYRAAAELNTPMGTAKLRPAGRPFRRAGATASADWTFTPLNEVPHA